MRMTRVAVAVAAALLGQALVAPALMAQEVKGAEVTTEEATTSAHPVISLLEAAKAGDSLVALELLKNHADANAAESDGTTELSRLDMATRNDLPGWSSRSAR